MLLNSLSSDKIRIIRTYVDGYTGPIAAAALTQRSGEPESPLVAAAAGTRTPSLVPISPAACERIALKRDGAESRLRRRIDEISAQHWLEYPTTEPDAEIYLTAFSAFAVEWFDAEAVERLSIVRTERDFENEMSALGNRIVEALLSSSEAETHTSTLDLHGVWWKFAPRGVKVPLKRSKLRRELYGCLTENLPYWIGRFRLQAGTATGEPRLSARRAAEPPAVNSETSTGGTDPGPGGCQTRRDYIAANIRLLRAESQMTIPEIAGALRISADAVKSHIRKAKPKTPSIENLRGYAAVFSQRLGRAISIDDLERG